MTALDKDQQPWLPIARAILDRKWDKAAPDTLEALEIGLRSIEDPTCVEALRVINGIRENRKRKPA